MATQTTLTGATKPIPQIYCQGCHLATPASRPRCVHCNKPAQDLNCHVGNRVPIQAERSVISAISSLIKR